MPEKTRADYGGPEELPPIPDESVEGWREIPIAGQEDPLVPLGAFTEFSDCDTNAAYFGEREEGSEVNFVGHPIDRSASLITHFLRRGTYEKLQAAQATLPEGIYFKFYDTYRPLAVQQTLFDDQKEALRQQHPDWDEAKLQEETQTYVALPSPNPDLGTTHPSPHSTGAVLDFTFTRLSEEGMRQLKQLNFDKLLRRLNYQIKDEDKPFIQEVLDWIDKQNFSAEKKRMVEQNWLSQYRYFRKKAEIFKNYATELDMGTNFDHFGSEAATNYYEKKSNLTDPEKEIRNNRRLLYKIMRDAGFANYPEEWWHWSYGDQMWAANLGKQQALYGGINLAEDNKATEESRRGVHEELQAKKGSGKEEVFL